MKKVKRMMFGGISKAAGKTLGQVSKMPGGVNQNAPADVQKMMANLPRGSTVAGPGTGLGVKPTVTGAPDKNLPFIINNKPIPNFIPPGTRPGVTTGGPKPGVAIGPQNINPVRPVLTAQTAKQATPPPTVMPQGVNPNFRSALANAPKYTGPGFGPTKPLDMAKINALKSALQGKPMPTPAPTKPNPMGGMFGRMAAKPMKKGGTVSSASKRADGIAVKGKTRGRIV